jgi:hypothetical protein
MATVQVAGHDERTRIVALISTELRLYTSLQAGPIPIAAIKDFSFMQYNRLTEAMFIDICGESPGVIVGEHRKDVRQLMVFHVLNVHD